MATVAALTELNSSSNITGPYTTAAGVSPAVGDQLVVFVACTGTVDDTATLTESAGGGAYTLQEVLAWSGTSSRLYVFTRNTLCENTTARTFTFNLPADAATGCIMSVVKVVGLTKAGTSAVRQVSSFKNSAATTPAVAMDFAIDTANPVVAFLVNGAAPPAITLPGGFSSVDTHSYSTPTTGAETIKDESGNTSSTITWGSSSATAWGAAVIELDTSAAGQNGTAALGGGGALAASGVREVFGSTAISGGGALAVSGVREVRGSAALAGGGSLTASGTVTGGGGTVNGTAALSGGGGLAVIGLRTVLGSSVQARGGTLTVVGLRTVLGSSAPAGGGTLTVVGLRTVLGAIAQSGGGTLTVAGLRTVLAAAGFTLGGVLTANGIIVGVVVDVPVILSAEFEAGIGQIEYEGGVRVSEYADGMEVVEF